MPLAMIKESIDQCAVSMTCTRVDNKPLWLIENYEVLIFKYYVKRYILRLIISLNGVRDVDNDSVA